jgi:hypothetical protein
MSVASIDSKTSREGSNSRQAAAEKFYTQQPSGDPIMEQDQGADIDFGVKSVIKSKTGRNSPQHATRDMFSYRSELKSLIGNLQETT